MDFERTDQRFRHSARSARVPVVQTSGLAVLEAECSDRGGNPAGDCAQANADNINATMFDANRDGAVRVTCR